MTEVTPHPLSKKARITNQLSGKEIMGQCIGHVNMIQGFRLIKIKSKRNINNIHLYIDICVIPIEHDQVQTA